MKLSDISVKERKNIKLILFYFLENISSLLFAKPPQNFR